MHRSIGQSVAHLSSFPSSSASPSSVLDLLGDCFSLRALSTCCTLASETSTPGRLESTLVTKDLSSSMAPRPLPPAPGVAGFVAFSSAALAGFSGAFGVASSSLACATGVTISPPAWARDMARACCRMASSVISTSPSASTPCSCPAALASPEAPSPVAMAAGAAGVAATSAAAPSPLAAAAWPAASALLPPSCSVGAPSVLSLFAAAFASRSRCAWASWRARSSSMLTRSARASSGSKLGSTPNSKSLPPPPLPPPMPPLPPAPLPPAPSPSSMKTGVDRRTSLSTPVPGGTVTRWLLSFELTAARKASSLAWFSAVASSPKLTMSMLTLFFFSFLATFTRAFSSSTSGEPMKATMRCRWFLFCRCLSASCAICTPWMRETWPSALISCMQDRTRPKSGVGVARTFGPLKPARESTPTVFSGLDPVFAPARRFTASV
mmetsp:Transcript_4914/g.12374  ORF Transcript_4914/g.12374 Transcript_4914/m.12374 type:complete len:438 (+) Transcript_4914:109-1422(+)